MHLGLLCPALVFALAPAMARADGADREAADALFREGRLAADVGNYAVACPKFAESYRLDPAPGTLLNLGDCEENQGELALAQRHFRQLYDELPVADERKAIAGARARAVENRASRLLHDTKLRPVVGTVPTPHEAPQPLPPARDANVQRTAAFVVGGVGVSALVTGGVFGVVALAYLGSSNAACSGNVCASEAAVSQFHGAQSFAIAADVAVSVGVALIGTAIVLALTGPRDHGVHAAVPNWIGGRF